MGNYRLDTPVQVCYRTGKNGQYGPESILRLLVAAGAFLENAPLGLASWYTVCPFSEEAMTKLQDIAELLVASWVLSTATEQVEMLPTSHGLLDLALERALNAGAFPPSWRGRLHFVDSRIGLQCIELQAVIDVAQRAEFTSEPNPSYKATRVKIGPRAARALLRRHGVSEDLAKTWGSALHSAVNEAKASLDQFPTGV